MSMRNTTIALRSGLLALCLAAGAGRAQAWTTPERVDRRPEHYVIYLSDIAVAHNGTPHVVWSECPSGTYYEKVMYARKLQDTWTVPLNISRDSGDLRTPAIALDVSGSPMVVWSQEGAAIIRYVRQVDDTWSLPKQCFPNNGITPRLVSDSRGRVHLVFEDLASPGGIWYSYYVASADSWATPVRVALGTSELGWSSLAVDRNDHLHAAWMNYGTNGIDYAYYDGTGWSAPTPLPDPAPSDQSCEPRIAVDTAARPLVVWQERSGGYWLYYSCRDADSWTSPTRLSPLNAGPPSICTDSFSRVYVVWGWYQGLRCVVRTDTGWTAPEQISDTTAMQEIASDGQLVHIAWRDAYWNLCYCNSGAPGVAESRLELLHPSLGIHVSTTGQRCRATFFLDAASRVSLSVLDAAGRRIYENDLGELRAGSHSVLLSLDSVPTGLYFGRLYTGNVTLVTKFTIVR